MFNIPNNTTGGLSMSSPGNSQATPQVQPNPVSAPVQQQPYTPPQQTPPPAQNFNQPAQQNPAQYVSQQPYTPPQQAQQPYNAPVQPAQQQFVQPQPTMQTQTNPVMPQPSVAPSTGNGVSLMKRQSVSLTKNGAPLSDIFMGLSWDCINGNHDLDLQAWMLGPNGKVLGDAWFLFYNQLTSPDQALLHHGDERTGAKAGDDEKIDVALTRVNPNVQKIVFTITISDANVTFANVANACIHAVDKNTNNELCKFNLSDSYGNSTALIAAELVRNANNGWDFHAVGDALTMDLAGLCTMYGVSFS